MGYLCQLAPDLCRSKDSPREASIVTRVHVAEDGAPFWEVVGSVTGVPQMLPTVSYATESMLAGEKIVWTTRVGVIKPLHRLLPSHQDSIVYFVRRNNPPAAQWHEAVFKLLREKHPHVVKMHEHMGVEVRVYPECKGVEISAAGFEGGEGRWISCYRGERVSEDAVPFLTDKKSAVQLCNAVLGMSKMMSWF
jgi:hypothetical protein